jgi:nitrate/nitrite transporter NarK
VRLGLLFLSRCCVSYYYGVLFLYIIELYPEQVRSIGFGTVSAAGALGGIGVQKVVSLAQTWKQDPLAYLLIFALLCLYSAFHLPETHGQPLQLEIEELRTKRKSQRYEPSMEESFSDLPELSEESERKAVEPTRE